MNPSSLCHEFEPMQLKEDVGDEWVAKTLPPDPLHTNLLSPVNDALDILEEHFEEQMEIFYKNHCLNKTGEGPGGKFNGPSLKTVLNNLNNLADILPNEGFPFIEYLQSIREVHHMCIAEVFDDNSEILIEEFKCKFDKLYKDFKLPMTLKVHVIVHHYSDYFKETKTNFRKTNGEHHEAIHHTIKVFETKQKTLHEKAFRKPHPPGKMPPVNLHF